MAIDSHDSCISSESILLTTVGIKDLVVVTTSDAVRIADRHRTADVKRLVTFLKEARNRAAVLDAKTHRAWGWYQTSASNSGYEACHLSVHPKGRPTLERHAQRCEHRVVVRGQARIVVEDEIHDLKAGQSVSIPENAAHKLVNSGDGPCERIETQFGANLSEADVFRLEYISLQHRPSAPRFALQVSGIRRTAQ